MADTQEQQKGNKGSGSPVPALAVITLIGCAGSAFLAANMMAEKVLSGIPGTAYYESAGKNKSKSGGKHEEIEQEKNYVKAGEYIVNLANREATRYLKTDITFEYIITDASAQHGGKKGGKKSGGHGGGGLTAESPFAGKEALANDVIIESLSSFTSQELAGTEGKKMLKERMIANINKADFGITVTNVYFNSFMIQ